MFVSNFFWDSFRQMQVYLRILCMKFLILSFGDRLLLSQNHKMIIVEDPSHEPFFNDEQLSFSMLSPILPPASIDVAIRPEHFTVAMLEIPLEKSFIAASTAPSVDTVPRLFILFEIPFVFLLLGILISQFTRPLTFTFSKLSSIGVTICPVKLSKPIELSFLEISFIYVPILVFQNSLTRLLTIFKNPFVFLTVRLSQNPIPFHFVIHPFAQIAQSLRCFPRPSSLLFSMDPLTIVVVPVHVVHDSISMVLPVMVVSLIKGSVLVLLKPLNIFMPIGPESLIIINLPSQTAPLIAYRTPWPLRNWLTISPQQYPSLSSTKSIYWLSLSLLKSMNLLIGLQLFRKSVMDEQGLLLAGWLGFWDYFFYIHSILIFISLFNKNKQIRGASILG